MLDKFPTTQSSVDTLSLQLSLSHILPSVFLLFDGRGLNQGLMNVSHTAYR